MKKIIKAITAVSLAALTFCSAAVVSVNAAETNAVAAASENAEVKFSSLREVDETIQRLFAENKAKIFDMVKNNTSLRDKNEDNFSFYWGSCGPTAKAFQKILADNNIYVEVRKQSANTEKHAYNLMRVSFDGGNTVKNIIIDPTYKQTMRDYFKGICKSSDDAEIDKAIIASGLPDVNVFEFGKTDELYYRINNSLPEGYPSFGI